MVLTSADSEMTLDKLADLADKVMEVATPPISSISSNPPPAPPSELQQLKEEMARLTARIESLTTRPPRRRHNSRPRRPSSPPPPTTPPSDINSLCWYHAKYGEDAQKRNEPWAWASNKPAGR